MSIGVFSLAFIILEFTSSILPALFYTDPGTGLLIWQIIVGTILGALFYARRWIMWLKAKLGGS